MRFNPDTFNISGTRTLYQRLLVIGFLGLVLTAVGYFVDSAQMFHSYLTAFTFWVTIGLGGLFFLLMAHLTGAVWSVVIRRLAESITSALPLLALLFIPLFFGIHELYHWSHKEAVLHDHLLQWKSYYLNMGFFILRTVVYFACWIFISQRLIRLSSLQTGVKEVNQMKHTSAWGTILFALTFSFASFDWLMSLDPHWYSTIYGVYIFGGAFLTFIVTITLSLVFLQANGILRNQVTKEHYHDLGKLLFGFTVFWAYIAAAQYFLIWYGNIPEETIWYRHRGEGSWMAVSLILAFGHFVIPFSVLIFYRAKRSLRVLVPISILLLLMHYVDLYWNIMPNLHTHNAHFSWQDITTLVGIGGVVLAVMWRNFARKPVVPVRDPRLNESIGFINH